MSVVIEVRNPNDLTSTYDQIEIQRSTTNTVAGMADIKTDLAISTTWASDRSTGYTAYTDDNGTAGTHYYRFRFKNSSSSITGNYSDIFLSGGSTVQTRFRNKMKDNNSNNYFFSNSEVQDFEIQAVHKLFPITWFETYDDSAFVPDGTTEVFTFPTQVIRLNALETRDSEGEKMRRVHGYRVQGRNLIFDHPPDSNVTLRAWVEKRFLKLSEVPDLWDSHIINLMRLEAFETMEAERSRFFKYNTIAKPSGGSLPSLDRIITRIEQQIKIRENQLRRVRKPVEINLTSN